MDPQSILLPVAALVLGILFGIYGALLTWRPDLFLRFHDCFVDRSPWSRNAAWRKEIYTLEYKLVGIVFFAFGVLIIVSVLTRLFSALT